MDCFDEKTFVQAAAGQENADTTLYGHLHDALWFQFSPAALWDHWLEYIWEHIQQSSSSTDSEVTMETPVRASVRESKPTELFGCKLTFLRLLKDGIIKENDD